MTDSAFAGARVLITGGLGFIGSSLAVRLVELGARVTLCDALLPDAGANWFNIRSIEDQIRVNVNDVCDRYAMNWLVAGQDYIFHLAGQVSHVLGLTDPFPDVEHNIRGTLVLLEAVRRVNPRAVIVATGTRGQYGPVAELPATEDMPADPIGIYEATRLAAERLLLSYHRLHGIAAVPLRLSNVYGPRSQMKRADFGVVNWFVRLLLDGQRIPIYGDGLIQRDFVYIDDCVEALLACATAEAARGEVLNLGSGVPVSLRELANLLVRANGGGRWELVPFSAARKAVEPGDFYADIRKIARLTGWSPRVPLTDGLGRTLTYYREHRDEYWVRG
ncbi:MAG: NAD-dependent epimerase/dehydratase family protein [Gemmataceae bacterium]